MNNSLWIYILVGFFAQMIDGSLGMAYGVSATSFLVGFGVPQAVASASVHTAEIFTTAVSGFSHWRLGNIDKELVKKLILPGVLGGILGAYVLTNISGDALKPFVAIYLIFMGIRIILKAFNILAIKQKPNAIFIRALGLAGGLFDAIGGGGWGPIVTSTLISQGNKPRYTIGSVNFTEFFVTFAEVATFIFTLAIGKDQLWVIAGLAIGGVIAAPLAAFAANRLPTKTIMILVGVLIIFLNLRTLYQVFF